MGKGGKQCQRIAFNATIKLALSLGVLYCLEMHSLKLPFTLTEREGQPSAPAKKESRLRG